MAIDIIAPSRRGECCEYCGLLLDSECPRPVEHAAFAAANETHWREVAERRMVAAILTPDSQVRP